MLNEYFDDSILSNRFEDHENEKDDEYYLESGMELDDENGDEEEYLNIREFNSEIDYIDDDQELIQILIELSMTFIMQYFPCDNDLNSPLIHFADILGISNKYA